MKTNLLYLLLAICLGSNAQNSLKVGDVAPKINITDKILNYPDKLSLKNKFIVLEFWATWCKPCLKAVPKLNLLEEKFSKNKNLIFLSITDESPKQVAETLKKIRFKSIVLSDQSGRTKQNFIASSDGSTAIPATILIDDKNIVRWIGLPNDLNETILEKFLEKKKIEKSKTIKSNKIDQPIFRKQIQTNISDLAYRTVNNDSTKFTFSIIRNSPKNNYLNLNYLKINKTYMDFNKSIEGLLANVIKVNKSQIRVPDSLKNRNYSLFYKNSNIKNENDGLMEIKSKIEEFFNIKEKITFINQNNYALELIDEQKFENFSNTAIAAQNIGINQFVFSAIELEKIIFDISAFYNINIIDETKLNGYFCSFLLPNSSIEKTIETLQNNGLKLKLISDQTPIFVYE